MAVEAEALLKHLGLTEYEAKALLVLLMYGNSNAEKISSLGAIPLPRVYDTMGSLAERGLISISRTRPQVFRAINPKRFFDLLKEDEKRAFQKRLKEIDSIAPEFLKLMSSLPTFITKEEEDLAFVRKRINLEKYWSDFHSQAKHEILVFAGDLSWVNKTENLIKKTLKKGIKYKILWCKASKDVARNVRILKKLGIEAKYTPDFNFRGIIIDENKISIVQTAPKPGAKIEEVKMMASEAENHANFGAIIINNKLITNIFKNYFLLLWESATNIEKFLKKF